MRKDGSRFWANVVFTAIRDEGGELCGFTKVTPDLTERRAIEEALRLSRQTLEDRVSARTAELAHSNQALLESEERYRLLFERNLAGVWRSTLDGEIPECNAAMARILGLSSPDEAKGHNAMSFYASLEERGSLRERIRH